MNPMAPFEQGRLRCGLVRTRCRARFGLVEVEQGEGPVVGVGGGAFTMARPKIRPTGPEGSPDWRDRKRPIDSGSCWRCVGVHRAGPVTRWRIIDAHAAAVSSG